MSFSCTECDFVLLLHIFYSFINMDLDCIYNLVKEAGEENLKSKKSEISTRGDNKTNKNPTNIPEFYLVMFKETIKQILECQDKKLVDEREYCNSELKTRDEKITKLEKENRELRQQIDNVSQYNRRDNLKILGVPYDKDEDINQIVKDIAKHTTGETLEDSEISVAHRLMTKDDKEDPNSQPNANGRRNKTPSIIVKFARRNTKTKVFESRKQTTIKPSPPYPNVEIYEDVTPLRSRILYALRNKKDSRDVKVYRYVWSRDGRIYARTLTEVEQIPQPKPHIINRPEDLAKLGWSPNEIEAIIHNNRD